MRLYQVDAFTSQVFRGNPAAVCLLDGERDAQWTQNVAASAAARFRCASKAIA